MDYQKTNQPTLIHHQSNVFRLPNESIHKYILFFNLCVRLITNVNPSTYIYIFLKSYFKKSYFFISILMLYCIHMCSSDNSLYSFLIKLFKLVDMESITTQRQKRLSLDVRRRNRKSGNFIFRLDCRCKC